MGATLWLVGMMGSGKSTVAPLVAGRLGRPWYDSDDSVAEATGRSVTSLLSQSEHLFREAEAAEISRLAGREVVVACGGGVVTGAATVAVMRSRGFVVWLDARLATLSARVGAGQGRPLLRGDPELALQQIDAERRALYRAAAHAVVVTDDMVPEEVAEEVVRAWNASSGE